MRNTVSRTSAEKPLEGAVLCCTSILPEDRAQLAEYAQEMGATSTLDLTSDVTHLLVGKTDSKKYQYVAKEREDVKVLLPGWVNALRKRWMADEPIDLNALDAEYKCPPLYGLKICITGFEDLDFRMAFAKDIANNGGEYTGDLTRNVTHLIACHPQGKKYEYAGQWGIKVVSLSWYKDTLDRGMQLDESLYSPLLPREQQGFGAWNRLPPGSTRTGKRLRDDKPVQEPSRKLRRAASARFGSQQHDMWNDIVGPPSDHAAVTSGTQKLRPAKSESNISAAPVLYPKVESAKSQPLEVLSPHNKNDSITSEKIRAQGFLTNKHFALKGFNEDRKRRLFGALAGNGATVHESPSALMEVPGLDQVSRLIIVPHDIEHRHLVMVQTAPQTTTIVTELWLEYCMTVKGFVAPDVYPLAAPVCPVNPIPGMSKLTFNASGFHQVQIMHIAKTVRKLGGTYQENFNQQTSVLVCCSTNLNDQKITHAESWNVPAVTEKWLWKLLATNRVPSFDLYKVGKPVRGSSDLQRTKLGVHDQPTSRAQSARVQDGESGAEDSFVEAAKAIQAREASINKHPPANSSPDVREKQANPDKQPPRTRENAVPLQEVSANIMSKTPRAGKKKLFRQFDGNSSDHAETELQLVDDDGTTNVMRAHVSTLIDNQQETSTVHEIEPPTPFNKASALGEGEVGRNTDSSILKEFFEVKAAAEARRLLASSSESKGKKNKLMGRALSNLSNTSRKSAEEGTGYENGRIRQPLSRASSINSLNTDGLGVPLSNLSRLPSELVANNTKSTYDRPAPSLTGNTHTHLTRAATDSILDRPSMLAGLEHSETSFHAALATLSTSQVPRPPSPTQQDQLTYADTDEAAKLKAHLAEKRRARARLGQNETDPGPELSREEQEKRKAELAREESNEKRQAKWRSEKERGALIRDDEKVVGAGRRTRGREKRLSALGGAEFGDGFGDAGFDAL